MERLATQGKLQRHLSGPHSAHVERQGHQLGEEAEVPGLADQRVEAGHSDVQRDQADLAVVPGRTLWLLDPAQAVWGLHHLQQPERAQEGQGTGHLLELDQGPPRKGGGAHPEHLPGARARELRHQEG